MQISWSRMQVLDIITINNIITNIIIIISIIISIISIYYNIKIDKDNKY